MTVAELIAELQTMPPDAVVIYRCCSDWETLDPGDAGVVSAEQSRTEMEKQAAEETLRREGREVPWRKRDAAICYRGGQYRDAYPLRLYPGGETPVYHDVVTLPGN